MFEHNNGILVCKEHQTPAQKNENGFWCRECANIESAEADYVERHRTNTHQLTWDYH